MTARCASVWTKDKELIDYKPATMKLSACEVKSRVDLEQSPTLVKLKEML